MAVKVSYRSKTDLVAEAIKAMIHNGELEAGEALHQREIADRLGVSPTPVREALRRLEAEGFVLIEPHRPAVVVRPDSREFYQSAVILGTLEGLGAELAAKRVTAEDIEALVVINRRLAAASDNAELTALDREFHLRICEITGSQVLSSQLKLLWRTIHIGPLPDIPKDEWLAQHQLIIDALAMGDCSEARDATNSHVLDAFKAFAPTEM
ncbi:MAG TPA: GntR family transcriptional regulator [Acidimicrobiia bacterium]|nr:GntR family transcriptional regulator [Acidimicrobiia bacterium]